jgi:hypothetical protein
VSFLFPLFLAACAAAAVPVVLHLARRRTRREVPFSSLMLLQPSPPRFESRRRIEHWLLLGLRVLALVLLAGAFSRPFFTRPLPGLAAGAGRRVVLLVDTSASMQREDLWARALARAEAQLAGMGPGDGLALYAFDRGARAVMGFEEWRALAPGERAGAAGARLRALAPGWGATDLGRALVQAADALMDDEAAAGPHAPPAAARDIVLVSDLQAGASLAALGASDWPQGVRLLLEPVAAARPTNVAVQALAATGERDELTRVRLASSEEGHTARVTLRWEDGAGAPVEATLEPGQSRVVEAPARPNGTASTGSVLVLGGDEQAFDDRLAVAPALAVETRIVYVGRDDGADPTGPLYFLQRAFPRTGGRTTEVLASAPDDPRLARDLLEAPLAVVTTTPGPAGLTALAAHLGRGRTVLWALDAAAAAAAAGRLAGLPALAAQEARNDKSYAVLTHLELGHPVLAPFADPRFADFTKIRFWRHRRLDERTLPGARVLGRFDDGSAAWAALPVGRGLLLLLTSGWQPSDSQLALSSKFVPFLQGVLEAGAGLDTGKAQFSVGDPVPLPAAPEGAARRVRRPDGRVAALTAGTSVFAETDLPGLYTLEGGGPPRVFAVNLAPSESATSPLPVEHFERLGISVARPGARPPTLPAPSAETRTAAWNAGLEAEQKPWRAMVFVLLALLVAETLLAGRLTRRASAEGGS